MVAEITGLNLVGGTGMRSRVSGIQTLGRGF